MYFAVVEYDMAELVLRWPITYGTKFYAGAVNKKFNHNLIRRKCKGQLVVNKLRRGVIENIVRPSI